MTKSLWRMRNIQGQEYSATESRVKHAQYSLYNLGIKLLGFAPWVLGVGVGLKLVMDVANGDYSGNIVQQVSQSLNNDLPWKMGFVTTTVWGAGGIGFGELYRYGREQLYGKGRQYNQVAVAASVENAQIRDAEREETEDLERAAMTPGRVSRTQAI
jgi:hypothetical protein